VWTKRATLRETGTKMRVTTLEYKGPDREIMEALDVARIPDFNNDVGRFADVRTEDNRKPRSWQIMSAIGEMWVDFTASPDTLYTVRNIHTGQWAVAYRSDLGNLY
jgi:hypothetical protein